MSFKSTCRRYDLVRPFTKLIGALVRGCASDCTKRLYNKCLARLHIFKGAAATVTDVV